MKKVLFVMAASAVLAATGFAGSGTMSSGKSTKEYKQMEAPTCFNDQELQLDTFGAYAVGEGTSHAGPIRDHAWGGGVGVNYFFARYFGVGVDGIWLDAKDNALAGNGSDERVLHNVTSSFILRYPIDSLCLAPYVFAGGGFHVDGKQWASAHGGLGVEYRLVPHKLALFADARWTYFGTRFGNDDQNNFLAKVGVRVVF